MEPGSKKLNVCLAIMIAVVAILNGFLTYRILNLDNDKSSPAQEQGEQPDDGADSNDEDDTGNTPENGVSTKACDVSQDVGDLISMSFDNLSLTYANSIWEVECKEAQESSELRNNEWAEFRLKSNDSVRVVFYAFSFQGTGLCFFGDDEPVAQTFPLVGITKDGLAIVQPAHGEKVNWTPPGIPAEEGGVYVVDHEVTASAITLTTNCLAGGAIEILGGYERNFAAFFSINDWDSLSPAEQTEVIALLSSFSKS